MTEWLNGLKPERYIAKDLFEEEVRKVFESQWLFFAPSERIERGYYLIEEVAGKPIVVGRRKDSGALFGFINSCPHRGAPLLNKTKGEIKQKLVCPFHGLSFPWHHLDQKSAKSALLEQQACKNLDVNRIQIFEYKSMIFVNLGTLSLSFFDSFSGFSEELAASFDKFAGTYHYSHNMTLLGRFNWKLFVEAYQECFHCPTVHPPLRRDFELSTYKITNKNRYSVHHCQRKHSSTETGEDPGNWFWLYPNTGMPIYQNVFYVLSINPISVNKTELKYSFFYRDQRPENFESFVNFVETIGREDIAICEAVQKNLEKGLLQQSLVDPILENGVEAFHSWLMEDLNRFHREQDLHSNTEMTPFLTERDGPVISLLEEQIAD